MNQNQPQMQRRNPGILILLLLVLGVGFCYAKKKNLPAPALPLPLLPPNGGAALFAPLCPRTPLRQPVRATSVIVICAPGLPILPPKPSPKAAPTARLEKTEVVGPGRA